MLTLADFFKHSHTVTHKQLSQQLHTPTRSKDEEFRPQSQAHQPKDLKILSPFYARIDQHPKNCKCIYHKRKWPQVKKITRLKTQPQEPSRIHLNKIQKQPQITINVHERIPYDQAKQMDFKQWMNSLSEQQLQASYLQYLKTLPKGSKFKRHMELDCYNQDFQNFLRKRYQEHLEKKKAEQIKQSIILSKRLLKKLHTQGSIVQQSQHHGRQNSQRFVRQAHTKFKRIGFKGTEKTFEFSEKAQSQKKNKRKNAKFFPSRPSFFGLIEDQYLLKQICHKYQHQNKRQNKEGNTMLKQLVEADIDLYKKILKDIRRDLEQGVMIRNMDQSCTVKLTKIVLQKLINELQSVKNRDEHFAQKNTIISDLCKDFGWSQTQKPISLHQFWRISQSSKGFPTSGKSLDVDWRSKNSRHDIIYSNTKFDKKTRGNKVESSNRVSAFSLQKPGNGLNFRSSNFGMASGGKTIAFKQIQNVPQVAQKMKQPQEFRVNKTGRNILKKGTLIKKGKKGPRQSNSKEGVKLASFSTTKTSALVRKQTCFFKNDEINIKPINDFVTQEQEQSQNSIESKSQNGRSSSMMVNTKKNVLRHIEANKKFLKRVETELKQKQCYQFVIGIKTDVLTKKRKIRAINQALQRQEVKQSAYYDDLLKYLEIYAQFCDLVVKNKKTKKIKSEISIAKLSQHQIKQKEEEEEQMVVLLNDLKKQRQLKYINLKWLQDQQDPREELILQMPQFHTQVDKAFEKERRMKIIHEKQKQETKFIELQKNESSIVQKDMQYKFNLQCQYGFNTEELDQTNINKESEQLWSDVVDFNLRVTNFKTKLNLDQTFVGL